MSDVARLVTFALCGTRMAADTEVCPKCGSLNAHLSYHTQFGALEAAEEDLVASPAPALPSRVATATSAPGSQPTAAHELPAQEASAVRHRPRVAAQGAADRRPQAPGEPPAAHAVSAPATAWQYSPIPPPGTATLSGRE